MKRPGERGVSAVEFALLLPLFLLILFGIIEFSMLIYDKQLITNASRQGARAGIVSQSPRLTTDDIQSLITDSLKDDNGNWRLITFASWKEGPVVTVPSACTESGDSLQVTVGYQYNFLVLKAFGIPGPYLTSSTTMTCE